MSKANRMKRCKLKSQPSLRDDQEMQALFQPLLSALGKKHAREFWSIIEKESEGVLAWGVRSGYLLWVRTHPGTVPTREQIAMWMAKGGGA